MRYTPIVPALIPNSSQEIKDFSDSFLFSKEFHLDVIDESFSPKSTWPCQTTEEPLSVKSYLDRYTLEVDLMVQSPILAAEKWIAAGADMLVFHVETVAVSALENFVESTDVSIGVSFSGDTSMEVFVEYLPYADYVQLMGIHKIGSQGQPFDERVFEKIAYLKEHYPNMSVTIDGSVNEQTIERLKDAGADRFIVGSAITLQEQPERAYDALNVLINR
jgi:pentose-5-phosphate-3-epimerase